MHGIGYDGLGLAWQGTLCMERTDRASITKYHSESQHEQNDHPEDVLAEDEATAETLTHEIGHNLGMGHDFQENDDGPILDGNGKKIYREVNGVDCHGYMDYK